MIKFPKEAAPIAKKFLSIKELSQVLGVSKSQLYDSVYRQKIPAKRLGRRILIPIDYVERELLSF